MAVKLTRTNNGTILSQDDRESPVPIPHFDKIELDIPDRTSNFRDFSERSLEVMLKMHINLTVQPSLSAMDSKIFKSLGVVVVRTKQKNFSSTMEKSNSLNLQKLYNQDDYDIIYQGLLSNLVDPRKIAMASKRLKNGKIMKIQFELKDCPENVKDHLSYYSACYLAIGDNDVHKKSDSPPYKLQKNNLKMPPRQALDGPISGERIIESGKLNTKSSVYRISSQGKMQGFYWTGPVKQTQDGKLMTARWTTSRRVQRLKETSPPMELEKATVRNSVIQDLRITKQVPDLKYDLEPTRAMAIEGRDTFNNSIKSPNSYTRSFLSRDMENNCRGLIFFDYYGFVAQESEFGKILTNSSLPSATRQKIFKNSMITNLKIIRKKLITRARGHNRLGTEIQVDESVIQSEPNVVTIVETTSKAGLAFLEAAKSIGPGMAVGTPGDVIGSIQEMTKLKNLQKGNRVLMFTDMSCGALSNGSYQYGIAASIEDGTLAFLNERLKRLKVIIEYLIQYRAFLQTTSNVQVITKNFQSAQTTASNNTANVLNNLTRMLTEFGIPVDDLTADDMPYPWILAPAYFRDTIKSVSSGLFADHPTNGSSRPAMLRPTAQQKLKYLNSSQSGTNDAAAKEKINIESIPRFDLNNSLFGMRSLLDPYTATQGSVSKAISLFEIIYQKISSSMGSSKQQSQPNSGKGNAISKNPAMSILNLKETFDQPFDTRNSHRPATDYIGFSTDLVTDVKTSGNFKTVIHPGANVRGTEFTELSAHVNAGLLAVTASDFELVIMDEEMMAEVPESQTDGPVEEISGDLSDRQKQRRKKLIDRLKEKRKESQRDGAATVNNPAEEEVALYLSPRLIDSRQGAETKTIKITSINENAEEMQQYIDMQNIVIATSAEISAKPPQLRDSTMQDRILGSLGIAVIATKTPINVAIDLNLNQGKDTNLVSEATILGPIDTVKFTTNALTNSECSDNSSLLLEMHKNQNWALPVTQEFVNILASNATLDRVTEQVDGNPRLINKTFPRRTDISSHERVETMMKRIEKEPLSVPPQIRKHIGSLSERETYSATPKDRFRVGMLAKVTIFMGYEGADVKKPIWKSPKNWSSALTDLRNDRTPHEFILCRVERQADEELISARGLEMTQTNMYFLITKNKSSLEIMRPPTEAPPARRRQQNRRTDEDPGVQRSVGVAIAPVQRRR